MKGKKVAKPKTRGRKKVVNEEESPGEEIEEIKEGNSTNVGMETIRYIPITMIGSINDFSGEPKEDVEDWLKRFEVICQVNSWDENMKCLQLSLHLQGVAKHWYKALREEEQRNYKILSVRLKNSFRRSCVMEHYQQQLDNFKQKENQSVDSYVYEKIALCMKVDPMMSEEMVGRYLISGFANKYKKVILAKNVKSKEKIIEIAKQKEGIEELCQDEKVTPINEQKIREIIEQTVQKSVVDSIRLVQEKPKTEEATQPVAYELKRKAEEFRCFNCGKAGHLQRNCFSKRPKFEVRGRGYEKRRDYNQNRNNNSRRGDYRQPEEDKFRQTSYRNKRRSPPRDDRRKYH